jgi:diguanylate cyclase
LRRAEIGAAGAAPPAVVAPRDLGHRGSLVGLTVVIAFLAVFGLWSAQRTNSVARHSTSATRLSDAYQGARFAVGQEESLERKYRLEPGPVVRAKYDAAARQLVAALGTVDRIGNARDHALVARLLATHRAYLDSIGRMFAAVDAGRSALVLRIDAAEVDPRFGAIETQVLAAAQSHRAAALQSLASLRATDRFAVVATIVALVLALALVGVFILRLAQVYRRLRRQAEASEYDARHDELTGLPNRTLFASRLEQRVASAERESALFSILMIDLDHFKEINDTLGHGTGDSLLRAVGPRLRRELRPLDTLARIGGDEFAVLLPSAGSDDAGEIAARTLAALSEPFALADLTVTVGASVGVASFPVDGADAATIVERSDIAMYVAKESGSGFARYHAAMDPYPQRLALVGELRSAIANDELELHYQPKFSAHDLHVTGVEALVRWRHPTRGVLPPSEFISLAEHTGLIKPLTRFVLHKAARQWHTWKQNGLDLGIAINLSVANLLDTELVGDVSRMLREEALPADRLEIEITESMVMWDPERANAQLHELAAMGIRLAIDDYGTGYSSLAYLRRLPVSELKIDRSFVRELARDAGAAAIVRSTIDLAHLLGLRVVAEGVDDASSLATLKAFGCDELQGFHLCRPTPPDLLPALLARLAARIGTDHQAGSPRAA